MSRSSVDLPQPDGPISETNSHSPIVRSMPSSAWTPPLSVPNVLSTPATRTTGRTWSAAGACSATGRRAVSVSREKRFDEANEPDEAEAEDRADDDRCPQAFRPRRVVLVVVEQRAPESIGDPRRELADERADDRRRGGDAERREEVRHGGR